MRGPEESRPERSWQWWCTGLAKAALALLIVYAPLHWFSKHYRIAYDAVEGAHCLPHSVFLVSLKNHRLERGDYVAFVSKQMQPFYKDGTQVVKLLAGVPGDPVAVNESGVWVDGVHWGGLLHAQEGGRLWKMGRHAADYRRQEVVPEHRLWVLGTHPRSYDSRYWGYITDEQVVGRAIPLW